MDCADRTTGPEEPPVHAFPLTGSLPAEFEPPPNYGPFRRWWWNRCMGRYRRQGKLDEPTGPLTMMLNLFLAHALDRGGNAFRLIVREVAPEDIEQRSQELEEAHKDSPHVLQVHRAQLAATQSWQHAVLCDPRRLYVWLRTPSGEWEQWGREHPGLAADDVIRNIMSLAPAGTCLITRAGDQPALLVTMRRLEGELEGLEVSWEAVPATDPPTSH